MNGNNENKNFEELDKTPIFPLIDEDTGEEKEFKFIRRVEIDDQVYVLLKPVEGDGKEYNFIFKVYEEGDDFVFASVEDDDEFDKVEDYLSDLDFDEIDYDA